MPPSSQMRAASREKQATHQPKIKETSTSKPSKNVLISTPPPRTPPKSLQNSKKTLSGVPGVSPEGPESSPRAPQATPECPWEVSGAPPERPRSPQRVRQSSGELKTTLWELKKLPPEASETSFWRNFAIVSEAILIELFLRSECLKSCLLPLMFSLFSSPLFSLLPPVLSMVAAALPPSYQRQSSKGAPGCAQR